MEYLELLDVLLPYQKAWVEDSGKVVLGEKGRRTGLTWAEALAQVLIASSEKSAGGMNCYYLAYNKDMTKDFILTCASWAKQLGIACENEMWPDPDEPEKDILVYQIRFASGFYIQALPSKKTALRSKQGRACIDEAAFVEELDELMKSALSLTMWGGQVRVISTHDGFENAFNLMIQEAREGRKPYGVHRIPFDEATQQGLYQRICLQQGKVWSAEAEKAWIAEIVAEHGDAADEELFCSPRRGNGRYFNRALLEDCSLPMLPLLRKRFEDEFVKQSAEYRRSAVVDLFEDYLKEPLSGVKGLCYAGMDFGRSGDLSVLWLFEVENDLELNTVLVAELGNWPFTAQELLVSLVFEELGHRFGGAAFDARGNGQQLAEYFSLEYGELCCGVMASRKWYAEAFPKLKAKVEDRMITLPRDTLLLDDFRAVIVDKGVPVIGERVQAGKNSRHGDAAVAACLGVFAFNSDEGGYVPYEYESVSKRG